MQLGKECWPRPDGHRWTGWFPCQPSDDCPCLAGDQSTRCDIPVLHAALEVTVHVSGGDRAQVHRAGPVAPDVPYPRQDGAKHLTLNDAAATLIAETGGDERTGQGNVSGAGKRPPISWYVVRLVRFATK